MKNRRSPLVNWTRTRTLRCSTITWRLSTAFSASSRLLGLKGEATRFNRKNISAIIAADVRRFDRPIKRTWFSAHTPAGSEGEGALCGPGAFPQGSAHWQDHASGMAIEAELLCRFNGRPNDQS